MTAKRRRATNNATSPFRYFHFLSLVSGSVRDSLVYNPLAWPQPEEGNLRNGILDRRFPLSARTPFAPPLARSWPFGNGDPHLLQRVLGSLGHRLVLFYLPLVIELTRGHHVCVI